MTTVAVLMTVYNHEAFLSEAIESVLAQKYKDFQLVICDDCSTDHSLPIAHQYAAQDDRIQVISKPKNVGRARLVNEFIAQNQAAYVALMDSDDSWHPDKLQNQVEILGNAPEVGVVHTEGVVVDSRPPEIRASGGGAWPPTVDGMLFSQLHYAPQQKEGDVFQMLLTGSFLFYSSTLIRNSYLKKVRMQEELKRSEDWVFFLDLARLCLFAYISVPLTTYRVHGNNEQDKLADRLWIEAAMSRLYVLNHYGQDMPLPVKANHFKHIGNSYRHAAHYDLSLMYLKRALRANPLDVRAWAYFFDSGIRKIG